MKITLLGPAYPYRGGLATIIETLARVFAKRSNRVNINTFTLQYPSFMFPGKSQFRDTEPPEGLDIIRSVNTVNPFNWIKVGRRLRREAPDMIVMKYWTPFMAPCFGTIARIARRRGRTKVIVQLDNVIPHEHHLIDKPFTRYFIDSCDGFVYMSRQVKTELDMFSTSKPAAFSPHPLFTNYGPKVSKHDACEALGLDEGVNYALFFGYIRDYKGLDLLLEAWALLSQRGMTDGRKLIVAGEYYGSGEKYEQQIDSLGLRDKVIMHTDFIAEDMVRNYFCAADLVIQPYRSATQSGVTQVAYYYDVPMVVTNVGGLSEIVRDGVAGYVVEPDAESIASACARFYGSDDAERFRANMPEEKKRFSWESTADIIEQLYYQAVGRP